MIKVITHNYRSMAGGAGTAQVSLCPRHDREATARQPGYLPPWLPSVDYLGVHHGLHMGTCDACQYERDARTAVRVDADGCATGVTCEQYHSGSHRLSPAPKRCWCCEGCGTFYSHHHVVQAQREE